MKEYLRYKRVLLFQSFGNEKRLIAISRPEPHRLLLDCAI